MITTIRIDGKKKNIRISDKDRLGGERLREKLGFKSFNGLVAWLMIKYEDDRQFISSLSEYVRYCLKREIIKNE